MGVLFITGVMWEFYNSPTPTSSSVNTQMLLLKIHGAASFIAMLFIGGVMTAHAIPFLNSKLFRKKITGIILSGLLLLLILTGYLLYYGSEGIRNTSSIIHFWAGVIVWVATAGHFLVRR